MISLNYLELSSYSIYAQLQLEEALLRNTAQNWCLVNCGTTPAIVLGISSKPEEMLDLTEVKRRQIPVIKRFSGGGTVFVDHQTWFVTWIFNEKQIDVPCCPQKIFDWTEQFYQTIFDHRLFALRENDYVFGEKKFGGNAQYLTKQRWLHHTSFLWDFDPYNMQLLQHPKKQPLYRAQRGHDEFLCSLKEYATEDLFLEKFKQRLNTCFKTKQMFVDHPAIIEAKKQPHRSSTKRIEI